MINNDNEKIGIIRHAKIDLDEVGNEVLLIKGYSVEDILYNRIVFISNSESETVFAGNSAVLIGKLINENFINPIDADRKIDKLEIDIDEGLGTNIVWKINSNKFVGDTISEICKINNLGYKIYLDLSSKRLVFKLYEGKDLSNKVVFAPHLDNIKNMRYTDSNIDCKNTAYIQITNNDIDSITKHYGVNKGMDRLEGFYNKGELGENESIEDIAKQYIDNNKAIKSIEGDITSTSIFTYKKDFELGDIVTVQNKNWGISQDLRIISIMEVYESNPRMSFVFGEPQPTLANKIKNYITNMVG